MKVDFFAWEFRSWIHGMRAFIDAISRASSEAAAVEAADELRRRAEGEGWEAEEFFGEEQALQETFDHWLPRLSTSSVIVLLHSLVETQLHRSAQRLRREKALSLAVGDINGRGIHQAKTYLIKVAQLDIANDLAWTEIGNLQGLRNVIVHSRGRVDPSNRKVSDELQRLMREYPEDLSLTPARSLGVVNNGEQEVAVTFRLCSHFLKEIEAFFGRLFRTAGFQEHLIE